MPAATALGFEVAATATCAGIVLGLYHCRDQGAERVLGYAEDFPAEAAAEAIATLERGSRTKQGRAWHVPDPIVDRVPEWTGILGRGNKRRRGR